LYMFLLCLLLQYCFFSEIIPKTIGAIYYKQLSPIAAHLIQFFIFITYPIILTTLFVTDRISKGKKQISLTYKRGAFREYAS